MCACTRLETPANNSAEGESVCVKLSLAIENELGTKAINDPIEITSAQDVIKDLWIIQFNGTSDDSRVIGVPEYIEDFRSWNGTANLISTENTGAIYFIANTFEDPGIFPINQWSTLGDLKALKKYVKEQEDLFGYENENVQHIIFSGKVVKERIDGTTEINAKLKRNIAKLNITIKNSTSGAGTVKISSIQLCSAPSISYYVTDLSDSKDQFPAVYEYDKVNYSLIPWPENTSEKAYTIYIPVNKRGTTQSDKQTTKNEYAPDGSTYLLINASYGTENYPLTYTFYLGENLVNDHNLEANRSYSYTFEITAVGDADNDSRVTDWGLVDFTDEQKYPLSNCYILNPMPNGTQHRHFRIPIKRIMEFWGTGTNNKYEDNYNYSLRDNAEWRCFIIASDFAITNENFRIVKGSGHSNTDPYFEVSVAPGTIGNVMIAVGHTKDNAYRPSWSWHLWITDYDPYPALEYGKGIEKQYIYAAHKGSVHRYKGWDASLNKEYIMDRNIGSLSADIYPIGNKGLLYYQYGRKDPFFNNSSIYNYYTRNHEFGTVEYNTANDASSDINGIGYSITHPLKFIKGVSVGNTNSESWTHHENYTNKDFNWNDPQTAPNGSNPGGKSIFDPCPPGYRLPDRQTWNDWAVQGSKDTNYNIVYNNVATITTNIFSGNTGKVLASDPLMRGFKSYLTVKGEQYWPNENGEDIPQQVVYYPAAGFLTPTGGSASNDAGSKNEPWAFVWSEDSDSNNKGMGIAHATQPDYLTKATSHRKARGMPVRCITDVKRHSN